MLEKHTKTQDITAWLVQPQAYNEELASINKSEQEARKELNQEKQWTKSISLLERK